MADGHGGARTPANPAAVSGPGALSQRTDGGPAQMLASGGEYGSRKDMAEIQSGAAMLPPGGAPEAPSMTRDMLTPLDAPTGRPAEPLTAGMNSVPNLQPSQMDEGTRERMLSALPVLAWLASQPKASEQTRQFFRQIRGDI